MKINDFDFSGDYRVSVLLHDAGTPQQLNLMEISRQDGAKLVSSNYAPKEITIEGMITGDDVDDLETNIDTFKKGTLITNGNLDMDYAGTSRRYLVDCSACTVTRLNYNVTFATFSLKYVASNPPFGQDISAIGGSLALTEVFSAENLTSETINDSFSVLGTSIPKVKVRYKFDRIGDISSIDFINLSTSKQMDISTAFTSGDEVMIDQETLNVHLNGEPVEFEGVFPDLKLGSNTIQSNVYLSSGTILDVSQDTNNVSKSFYGSIKLAQSFQVTASNFIPKVQVLLNKIGTISTDVTFRIETNSSGEPSGTAVANGTGTISSVSSGAFWNTIDLTDFQLAVSTTYWIVLSTTGGDAENYYEWKFDTSGSYANGSGMKYTTAWKALTGDFCFKVYRNVASTSNTDESQESVVENFSTTTYRDGATTTADWATDGILELSKTSAGITVKDNFAGTSFNTSLWTETDAQNEMSCNNSLIYYCPHTSNHNASLSSSGKYSLADDFTTQIQFVIDLHNYYYPNMWYGSNFYLMHYQDASNYSYIQVYRNEGQTGHMHIIFVVVTGGVQIGGTYVNLGTNFYRGLVKIVRVGNTMQGWFYNAGDSTGTNPYYATGSWVQIGNDINSTYTGSGYIVIYNRGATAATVVSSWRLYNYSDDSGYQTSNIGQSLTLDSDSSSIAAVTLVKSDTTPTSTAITYQVSGDGTNFDSVTPTTEKYLTNLGSDLRFKATLTTSDQSYTPSVDTIYLNYKLGAILENTNRRVAQSFESGFTGNCNRVSLMVKKFGTPGDLTVEIYSNSGGNPNALLATQTFDETGVLANVFGWINVNFKTPTSLTSGTTYWIVVSGAGLGAANGYLIRSRAGNTYTSGTLKYSTNSGVAYSEYANEDLLFKTFTTAGSQHQFDMSVRYIKKYL